jgi:hypothetical protein
MSHYRKIQVEMTDRDALVAAIRQLGMEPEIHDEPVSIGQGKTAHVVIRRDVIANTGTYNSYADIGWRFTENGVEAIYDPWLMSLYENGKQVGTTSAQKVMDALKPAYAEQRIRQVMGQHVKQAAIVNRTEENDVIRLTVRGYRPVAGAGGAASGIAARKGR